MEKAEKKQLEILCIADHVDPLIYSSSLRERFKNIDLIISCGDLEQGYYEYIVSTLNVPFIYVLGNHSQFYIKRDSMSGSFESSSNLFSGGNLADGRSVYLKEADLIIAGFGGSMRYNRNGNQYSEAEMVLRVIGLIPRLLVNKLLHGRFLDIFITHAPPRGINDGEDLCHRGFKIFRWFLDTFRPRYMIHGHVHLYSNMNERIGEYNGIPVINAYKHYILRLPETE